MSSRSKPRPFSFVPPTPPHMLRSFPRSISSPPPDTIPPIQDTPQHQPELCKTHSQPSFTASISSAATSAAISPTAAPSQAPVPLFSGRASLGDLRRPTPGASVGTDGGLSRRSAVSAWLDTASTSSQLQDPHSEVSIPSPPAVSATHDRDELFLTVEGKSVTNAQERDMEDQGHPEEGYREVPLKAKGYAKMSGSRGEGEEGQSLLNPNQTNEMKLSSSRIGLGQRYTIANFANPTSLMAQQKGFRRLDDEEVATRAGKSTEEVPGTYDRDGGMKSEDDQIFWKQTWFRWTMAILFWGILCMVVGGTVGFLMK